MKKTYIIPEMFSVQLGTCRMMAASDGTLSPNGENLEGGLIDGPATGDGLAKGVSDKNVWDEEW